MSATDIDPRRVRLTGDFRNPYEGELWLLGVDGATKVRIGRTPTPRHIVVLDNPATKGGVPLGDLQTKEELFSDIEVAPRRYNT